MPDFKLFTLAEAERTLPLVRRIVQDLTAEYPAWRAAVGRFEILTGGARADWGETQELIAARDTVTAHAERINRYLQELEAVGCVFKGFEAGLVDFYSLREDRPIFLCWRLGEDRITHWHEIESGFAGRQPIDGAILSARSCMIRFWLFLHLLGFTMWLGGGLAAMVAGIAGEARRTARVSAPSPARRRRSTRRSSRRAPCWSCCPA